MFACSLQFSKQQHETQRIRNAAHDDAWHDDDDDDVTLNTLLLRCCFATAAEQACEARGRQRRQRYVD